MFFLKALSSGAFFCALTGSTIYFAAAPLLKTVVDTNFFQDLSTVSADTLDPIFSTGIKDDPNNVKDYLTNQSWNFYAKHATDDSKSFSGNGFVLNLLTPDSFDANSGKHYSPNFSISSQKLIFLVGTSLNFASKLFKTITDFKNDVNEAETAPKLKDKKESGIDLFFSHPYINKDGRENDAKYLYEINKDYSSQETFILKEPHYVQLKDDDVSLIYAATDLEVNKKLFKLKTYNNESLLKSLDEIQNEDYSDIQWYKEIPKFLNEDENFKFAVDFAVMKVEVYLKDIKGSFLQHLKRLYSPDGKSKIPNLIEGSIDIVNNKTGSVFMAGWSNFNEKQKDFEIMKNLWILAENKKDKKGELQKKLPSEINETNFSEYFDLKFFETIQSNAVSSDEKKSDSDTNYEYTNLEVYGNDLGPILFVNYWIKNKKTGLIFPEKQSVIFQGFKTTIGAVLSQESEEAKKDIERRNNSKNNILVSKAKSLAEWEEIVFKHTYFDIRTIEELIFDTKILRIIESQNKDKESFSGIFKIGQNEYVNLSHQLRIPNLDIPSATGAVAVTNWDSENKLLGMYEGQTLWNNPFSNKKTEGKIILFVSPWRYDLFNYENNLSKYTLAESLAKKSLNQKLIFPMIFKNKPKDVGDLTAKLT